MKLFLLLSISIAVCAMEQSTQQWDGNQYKDNCSPQFKTAMELIETFDFSKYSQILDVGSGTGQVTMEMARRAPQAKVIGIDVNASMVQVASNLYHEVANLEFKQVDAQRPDTYFFPCVHNRFDLAFSSAVFLWIENKRIAFDNIHIALRSGGHMMIKTTAPRPQNHPLNRALGMLAQTPKWAAFAQSYMSKPQSFPLSIEQAEQIITTDKWTNVKVTPRGITNLFNSPQSFCKWMQGWMGAMPAVAALEKDKQIELCKDFVDFYVTLPETHDEADNIVYSLPGILIEADKK